MNLTFLHGRPATGKYTVGRELSALTGHELYHNHLVVDAVLKQHAFGTLAFVAMRDRLWREHLEKAARANARGLIFTFNPENTVPQSFIDWLFGPYSSSVRFFSVELVAPENAIESRIASAQRQQFKKLTDVDFYRQLRDAGAFHSPLIPRTDLRIDTRYSSPLEAARQIVDASPV